MESKINNIIKIPTSVDDFYKYWMIFLKPFHNLTNKEMDVAAKILQYRQRLSKIIKDDTVLNDVLLSRENRKKIREELDITPAHLQVILSTLKGVGFLNDGKVNPRFIPRINNDKQFNLLMNFDFSE